MELREWSSMVKTEKRADGWYVILPDGEELGGWDSAQDAVRYSRLVFFVD